MRRIRETQWDKVNGCTRCWIGGIDLNDERLCGHCAPVVELARRTTPEEKAAIARALFGEDGL